MISSGAHVYDQSALVKPLNLLNLFVSDDNECFTGHHNCSQASQDCVNTVPGFECKCATGYEKEGEVNGR